MDVLIFDSNLPYYETIRSVCDKLTIKSNTKSDGIYVNSKLDTKFRIEFINKVSELALNNKELGSQMLELYEILGMHEQTIQNLKKIFAGKEKTNYKVVQLDRLTKPDSETHDLMEILNLKITNPDDLVVLDSALNLNENLKKLGKNKLIRMGIFQLLRGETNKETLININKIDEQYSAYFCEIDEIYNLLGFESDIITDAWILMGELGKSKNVKIGLFKAMKKESDEETLNQIKRFITKYKK